METSSSFPELQGVAQARETENFLKKEINQILPDIYVFLADGSKILLQWKLIVSNTSLGLTLGRHL